MYSLYRQLDVFNFPQTILFKFFCYYSNSELALEFLLLLREIFRFPFCSAKRFEILSIFYLFHCQVYSSNALNLVKRLSELEFLDQSLMND